MPDPIFGQMPEKEIPQEETLQPESFVKPADFAAHEADKPKVENEMAEDERRMLDWFLTRQQGCVQDRKNTLEDLGGTGDPRDDFKLIEEYNQRTAGAAADLGWWLHCSDNNEVRQRREKGMEDIGLSFDSFKPIDWRNPYNK